MYKPIESKQEGVAMTKIMDCEKAGTALMQHMERSITVEDAQLLLQHVQECENCMEEYLMFDQVVEFAATTTAESWNVAPVNFTANVMAAVRKEPAYAPVAQPLKDIVREGNILSHILGGSGLIVLALALVIFYNPEHVAHLAYTYPAIDIIVSMASSIWAALGSMMNAIVYSAGSLSIENSISIAALAFVLLAGMLLVVLQRQEERTAA